MWQLMVWNAYCTSQMLFIYEDFLIFTRTLEVIGLSFSLLTDEGCDIYRDEKPSPGTTARPADGAALVDLSVRRSPAVLTQWFPSSVLTF